MKAAVNQKPNTGQNSKHFWAVLWLVFALASLLLFGTATGVLFFYVSVVMLIKFLLMVVRPRPRIRRFSLIALVEIGYILVMIAIFAVVGESIKLG